MAKKKNTKTNKKSSNKLLKLAEKKLKFLDILSPFGSVMLRIWIGLVFWKAGLTKIANWDTTIFLFEEEYKTHEKLTIFGQQILTPELSAFMATAGELILPILLIAGFGSRFAAFGLLMMTAVIEFTYQSFDSHIIWAIILGTIILQGPGKFSWDYFVRSKFYGFPKGETERDKLLASFFTLALTLYTSYLLFDGLLK